MIELLNVDCMEYMKGLEDNAFELAIVDPPYGIDAANTFSGEERYFRSRNLGSEDEQILHCQR